MSQPILQLEGIEKCFPGVKALDGVNLSVTPGRVMALVGENGAGKSTLMKVLTGIYQAEAGRILYKGKETRFKGPRHSQQAGIGIIHQELNLLPELSIAENIFLGREKTSPLGRILWNEMNHEAAKLLKRLRVPHAPQTRLGDLSIGEQQMVEIAKAISFKSSVIIMDEPTDALTDTETQALFDVIEELKKSGHAIVYISHRLVEIFEICDDVTVLRDGKFIASHPVSEINEEQLIEMMVGRKLEEQYPRLETTPTEVSLVVKELWAEGVCGASFSVRKGEILGVAGLMGSGRTEMMRAIFGADPIQKGTLTLDGKPLSIKTPKEAIKKGIAYISEDRKGDGLVLGLCVKKNMTLASLESYSTTSGRVNHKGEKDAVQDYIGHFNIKTPTQSQIIGNLSGGNQQKVSIAKGLMTKPKVLILDEPTRGVDVGAKKEIYQLINTFKEQGMSIILVSSEMPEILGMSDRIIVMHEGRVSGEFPADEANQEKLMACAVGKNG